MDVCVVEVGMGGRYDATNIVPSPVVCGVAMLDLDHTQVRQKAERECCRQSGICTVISTVSGRSVKMLLPLSFCAHGAL